MPPPPPSRPVFFSVTPPKSHQPSLPRKKWTVPKEECFIRYPNTDWEVGWKNEAQPSLFNQLISVLISDETLFRVFNIASQSLNNSSRNSRQKSIEFYDNWDHISKLLHGNDFLVFFTWIINECENARHNPLKSTIIGKQGCASGGISLKVI